MMDYKGLEKQKVSVIIACYNQELYITESVLSVINQSYKNVEVIIVNDGSTDSSVSMVNTLIKNYPSYDLKLYSNLNQGLAKTRNFGAGKASGDYLLFLDGDDRLRYDFLEKTAQVLDTNLAIGFVYTQVQHFGARNDIWSGGQFHPIKILIENQLTCTSLVRKKAFDEVLGFKEIFKEGYEDWEFWINCVEKGWSGYLVDEPLFYYRKHESASMLDKIDDEVHKKLYKTIQGLHPNLYNSLKQYLSANNLKANLI